MNRRNLVRGGIVLLAAAVVLVVSLSSNRERDDGGSPAVQVPAGAESKRQGTTPYEVQVTPAVADGAGVPGKVATDEEILVEIEDAAVTYDAKSLPVLNRYLLHGSAEVRRAARDGMITLGSPQAAPLLLDAARQMADVKEARELMEAAEYMQLPAGKLTRKGKKEGAAGQ